MDHRESEDLQACTREEFIKGDQHEERGIGIGIGIRMRDIC